MKKQEMGAAAALLLGLLGAAGCASTGVSPEGASVPSPLAGKGLRIRADRPQGLAPMELEIVGEITNQGGESLALAEDERVRLQVETTHYRLVGGGRSQPFQTAGIDEIDAGGLADPLVRNLVIRRPGTYNFQFILEDLEGNQLRSNILEIKAI